MTLGDLDFLSFRADFSSPRIIAACDELPLWSAMFGLLLLDEVPLSSVRNALDFLVRRVVKRESVMHFANGAALFNHHFIKLGFLDEWKKVVPGKEELIFRKLPNRLTGEVGLTIPMAYLEGVAV